VVLRHVDGDEFASSIKNPERKGGPGAFRSNTARQPAIFGIGDDMLKRTEIFRTCRRRHVSIEHNGIWRLRARGINRGDYEDYEKDGEEDARMAPPLHF
jgi:hypothetical protein